MAGQAENNNQARSLSACIEKIKTLWEHHNRKAGNGSLRNKTGFSLVWTLAFLYFCKTSLT